MKKNLLMIAALALAACGGGNTVTQYLVATDVQFDVSKNAAGECPKVWQQQNEQKAEDDKTDQIINMYTGHDGTVYVEYVIPSAFANVGGTSHLFEGKKNGSNYDLNDTFSDVQTPTGQNVTETTSQILKLSLTESGDAITGTLTEQYHEECSGTGCQQNSPITDCIYATNLRGTKIPNSGNLSVTAEPSGTNPPDLQNQ